jgi:putative membrane protein
MRATFLSVVLLVPVLACAADATPDSSFYKHLAEGGIAEVDAGNLAAEKATDPKIKDFAAMMVKDHTAANDKFKALADSKGIKLPTSASAGQMASEAKLKVLSGNTFDDSYIKGQVKAHQQTVSLLQKEIASGQDTDAKSFAQSMLPTVRAHLKKANTLAAAQSAQNASK